MHVNSPENLFFLEGQVNQVDQEDPKSERQGDKEKEKDGNVVEWEREGAKGKNEKTDRVL